MLVKITDKCSMGCSHCMSDCTPNGEEMSLKVFEDVIKFQNTYGGLVMTISGGEPTEHTNFKSFLRYAITHTNKETKILVTTNGLWLTENLDFMKELYIGYPTEKCEFQIVVDDRYYPIHVNESSPVFDLPNVMLCHDVYQLYPQGRALQNKLPFKAKSSKCFNIRALVKQLDFSLVDIFYQLNMKGKFCTPHIDINGAILLGESSLCPVCSSIYSSEKTILNDIKIFQCHQCDFINNNLAPEYKKFVE